MKKLKLITRKDLDMEASIVWRLIESNNALINAVNELNKKVARLASQKPK
jgi:hypothetical protein